MEDQPVVQVEYRGRVAVIAIDNVKKLNALDQMQYYDLSQKLREVATHDEVYITVLIGRGRFFSAGADVSISRSLPATTTETSGSDSTSKSDHDATAAARAHWLRTFGAFNLNVTQAFYSHPKVLVAALNGPVVGLSAALVAHTDFVYCAPSTYLLVPFASIGLVAEGGASRALLRRLGPARGREALLMSRPIPAAELLAAGFVNKILDPAGSSSSTEAGDDARFRELVLREVDERFGHLVGESLLGIKALIQRPETAVLDAQNVAEVFAGIDRFMSGVPQEEFRKLATGEKRHKL